MTTSHAYDVSYAAAAHEYYIQAADKDFDGKGRWSETDRLLDRLAEELPGSLRCFHSPLASTGFRSNYAKLYLVGSKNTVLFIGEAVTKKEFRQECEDIRKLAEASDNVHELAHLTAAERTGLSRTIYGCVIACMDEPILNRVQLESALRSYLERFCPPLVPIPIEWLPDATAKPLLAEIYRKRRHYATR